MTAKEFFQAGKLAEAVQALTAEVRNNPADRQRRTFLFELLCFAGEFDRAEKQLAVLAEGSKDAELGSLLYRAALAAERTRAEMFEKKTYPLENAAQVSGTLNGKPFSSMADSDSRIGPRLEVFAAGQYMWIPFAHIESVETQPPRRLRDLLWAPAIVRTGPAFRQRDLGEVLLPVLAPLSFRHPDEAVRLGRSTVWEETEDGQTVPLGQKVFDVGGEEVSILEIRHLEFSQEASSAEGA